nr:MULTISPECIES: hypothetical protein [unclassified Oceanispirochaeta]
MKQLQKIFLNLPIEGRFSDIEELGRSLSVPSAFFKSIHDEYSMI